MKNSKANGNPVSQKIKSFLISINLSCQMGLIRLTDTEQSFLKISNTT